MSAPITDERQLNALKKSGMPLPAKPTYKDFLVARVIMKSSEKGDVSDLMKIMQILGEEIGESAEDAKIDELLNGIKKYAAAAAVKDDAKSEAD